MQRAAACLPADDSRYGAFSLAPDLDGVTFYEAVPSFSSREPPRVRKRGTLGQPCKGARQEGVCLASMAAIAAETSGSGWVIPGGTSSNAFDFAIATRGDSVFRVSNRTELAGAIAPIDRDEEAVALVQMFGDEPAVVCWAANLTQTPEGYLVKALSGSGCERMETLYSVDRMGHVDVAREQRLETCDDVSVPVTDDAVAYWEEDDVVDDGEAADAADTDDIDDTDDTDDTIESADDSDADVDDDEE